ncbi:TonB-dependent receptor plug domain-containing protein [Mucilaginibacter kameinonensis]|uniref:TonB-dependent receptor plug domain-containing protein n=1 Tax=Mucilaginibacter kameinonensis TaxID=452286 RepID=UPI000EF81879|nr:TonB-dependent receptor plug domain-containing protein [Mucilaginibacter kameinonensis]
MKYLRAIPLLVLLLLNLKSFAQTDSSFLKKAVALSNKQLTDKPTEKVYLHLDKPFYNITDTIWFKVYTVTGAEHQLSDISGVVHVELINAKDSVARRLNLKLTNGVAWGDFVLPGNYKAGSYRLRAYTNWMRNQGTVAMFDQRIQVNGRPVFGANHPQNQPATENKPDVQFFAEGGSLVNGLRSKIAVKVIGQNGLGRDAKGSITDNDGNEVAEFETTHLGMGIFALLPQAGKTYKAKITTDGIPSFTVDLPKAGDEGFTMTVNNRLTDSINIKLTASSKTLGAKQHAYYYLVGQSGGKVYYTTSFKLEDPGYSFKIEKKRFPSGIAQFTLFGADAEPLNERIAFIRANDTLKLKLNIAAQKFETRKAVSVVIEAANKASKPVVGAFSVSVINESRIPFNQNAESTILNNLLLTSDLKGYIEQPNYYFNNITDKTESDLDMLMLTQGYHGFEWRKTLNAKQEQPTFKAESSLSLAGSLQTPGGKSVPNGKVLLLGNREDFYADTVTDINGDFKFEDVDVSDTSHLLVQARKENNGKNVTIFVKQADYPKVESTTADGQPSLFANVRQQTYAPDLEQQKIDSTKIATSLKEVIIKGKKAVSPNQYNKYGTLQQRSVNMAKLRSYKDANLSGALHSSEPLARIDLTGSYKYDALSGGDSTKGSVVVDGVYVEQRQLDFLHVEEIESVDLMIAPTGPPLIVVKTKRYAGTDTTVLKEVNIRATKTNKSNYKGYSAGKLGAAPDQIIMGAKLTGCTKLSDCLRSKVIGVTFDVRGTPISMRGNQKMAVILNGSVSDGSVLDNINPNDVYSIEVLRGASYAAILGSEFPGGALAITTQNGGNYVTGSSSSSGVITYPFKGFYKARTFYSPKYTAANINTTVPDYRTTIFWEPNIVTNETGEASFSYFNADTRAIYRVTVEGIDANGNLGRQVYRYKVE